MKIIITGEQLRAINEAAISFTVDNPNQVDAEYKKNLGQIQQAANSGLNYATFKVNGGNNNQGGFAVDVEKDANGNIDTSNLPATNVTKVNVPINQNESRAYSKRVVELGRMLEMRKRGKVFSKKQLNEMFMETQDNANRLRAGMGSCQISDIFDAVEEVFPEELDGLKNAFFNGADIEEYICSIFSKEGIDSEREEEFLDILGI